MNTNLADRVLSEGYPARLKQPYRVMPMTRGDYVRSFLGVADEDKSAGFVVVAPQVDSRCRGRNVAWLTAADFKKAFTRKQRPAGIPKEANA